MGGCGVVVVLVVGCKLGFSGGGGVWVGRLLVRL